MTQMYRIYNPGTSCHGIKSFVKAMPGISSFVHEEGSPLFVRIHVDYRWYIERILSENGLKPSECNDGVEDGHTW